jgi:Ca-activated chloride channel family protein
VYDVVLASTASSPVTVRIQHLAPFGREAPRESVFSLSPRAIAPSFDAAPASLRLAAAVAGFAEILRKSPDADEWHLADVERIARASADGDAPARDLVSRVHAARSLDDARALRRWSGRVADASLMGF